jgi:protein-S-isoprenylcysteine O-methyltransferase Ste14
MKRVLPWLLVGLQFLLLGLLALIVVVPHDRLWSAGPAVIVIAAALMVAGGVVALLGVRGLGSSLTASPVPLNGSGLVTSGI